MILNLHTFGIMISMMGQLYPFTKFTINSFHNAYLSKSLSDHDGDDDQM